MRLELNEMKVAHYTWATQYNSFAFGAPLKTKDNYMERKVGKSIQVLNARKLSQYLRDLTSIEELDKHKRVFFDKRTTFPRDKFKERFPDNPIKRSPKEADVIIVDINKVMTGTHVFNYGTWMYVDVHDNSCFTDNSIMQDPTSQAVRIVDRESVEKVYDFDGYYGKEILFVDTLLALATTDSLELTPELIDNTTRLLNSNKDDAEIGLQMLSDLNYGKCKEEIMSILYSTKWKQFGPRLNVYTKSLVDNIENEFPRWKYNDPLKISFTLGKKYAEFDSTKAQDHFNRAFKNFLEKDEWIEVKVHKKTDSPVEEEYPF